MSLAVASDTYRLIDRVCGRLWWMRALRLTAAALWTMAGLAVVLAVWSTGIRALTIDQQMLFTMLPLFSAVVLILAAGRIKPTNAANAVDRHFATGDHFTTALELTALPKERRSAGSAIVLAQAERLASTLCRRVDELGRPPALATILIPLALVVLCGSVSNALQPDESMLELPGGKSNASQADARSPGSSLAGIADLLETQASSAVSTGADAGRTAMSPGASPAPKSSAERVPSSSTDRQRTAALPSRELSYVGNSGTSPGGTGGVASGNAGSASSSGSSAKGRAQETLTMRQLWSPQGTGKGLSSTQSGDISGPSKRGGSSAIELTTATARRLEQSPAGYPRPAGTTSGSGGRSWSDPLSAAYVRAYFGQLEAMP